MKPLLINSLGLLLISSALVYSQPPMVKPGFGVKAGANYQPKQVQDSLAKIADERQMKTEDRQEFVNANMRQYYKSVYEQINDEVIEQSLIEVIKEKEQAIDELNSRIAGLQEENYQLRNANSNGLASVQQPLGFVQLYFPSIDFSTSYEVKAQKLLEAIQTVCYTKPNGKDLLASITEPEKNIPAGNFERLFKYRLQMLCMLINNK